ncbi:Thioredoxin [Trema orientale]|uniref:Thioredoxin n=1 Tax=Trema orientale TaxID=63057 RepID=A0A2P5F6Y7_TREOI|nr:Thioredoxin [Trema orientale]
MACSLKNGVCFSGFDEVTSVYSKPKGVSGFCSSFGVPQSRESNSRASPSLGSDFLGKSISVSGQRGSRDWRVNSPSHLSVHAQASICISRAMRWWEKTLKPNMVEIHSAQQLVDSLANAGDRLVIIDFYSPGCGGCKALHPKICQLAELNPNAIILKVNYEELKTMCHALHIHVLPFFRFYRGAEGRLCSFSCTNATIKKFKDALAKHGNDRCSLGPAKGLDESEILKLASSGEIQINSPLPSSTMKERVEDLVMGNIDFSDIWSKAENKKEEFVA